MDELLKEWGIFEDEWKLDWTERFAKSKPLSLEEQYCMSKPHPDFRDFIKYLQDKKS